MAIESNEIFKEMDCYRYHRWKLEITKKDEDTFANKQCNLYKSSEGKCPSMELREP